MKKKKSLPEMLQESIMMKRSKPSNPDINSWAEGYDEGAITTARWVLDMLPEYEKGLMSAKVLSSKQEAAPMKRAVAKKKSSPKAQQAKSWKERAQKRRTV